MSSPVMIKKEDGGSFLADGPFHYEDPNFVCPYYDADGASAANALVLDPLPGDGGGGGGDGGDGGGGGEKHPIDGPHSKHPSCAHVHWLHHCRQPDGGGGGGRRIGTTPF